MGQKRQLLTLKLKAAFSIVVLLVVEQKLLKTNWLSLNFDNSKVSKGFFSYFSDGNIFAKIISIRTLTLTIESPICVLSSV